MNTATRARRCVRRARTAWAADAEAAGVEALVLFGSRARGDHDADSDWDLCIVSTHGRRDGDGWLRAKRGGMLPDVLHTTRKRLAREAHRGTAWADVVGQGRVIAGDRTVLAGIEVKGMKLSLIENAWTQAGEEIGRAAEQAVRVRESTANRNAKSISATIGSTQAAEHIARGLLGWADLQPPAGHDVGKMAEMLVALASESSDAAGKALEYAARLLRAMNGDSGMRRGAAYAPPTPPEPSDVWEQRTRVAAELLTEVLDGLGRGEGPLADYPVQGRRRGAEGHGHWARSAASIAATAGTTAETLRNAREGVALAPLAEALERLCEAGQRCASHHQARLMRSQAGQER